ncbi:MAG: efflux RND transporter periplasmic adaptor subunit [Bacteroidales bacterium]
MKTKILVAFLALSIVACSGNKQSQLNKLKQKQEKLTQKIQKLEAELSSQADTAATIQPKLVRVMEIQPAPFNHFIEVQGKLDGDENVGVAAQALGKIVEIYVTQGQNVSKGQTLAKLDDAVLQQQLKQMETNLQLVTELYEKQKKLWEQNVGSEVQYLQAKTNKESLEKSIAALKDQIKMMTISSPVNGTVEEISVRIGQVVSPGVPLIRVVNFSKLKVVADVSETYSNKVNPGDKAKVYFPDLNTELETRISFVSRYINPVNRTFTVESSIGKPIPGLKANMVAVLKINDYFNPKALILSSNLINKDQNGNYIYVVAASSAPKARKIYVQTGMTYNGMMEITGGIEPGSKVITVGYQNLRDGDPVQY